MWIFCSRIQDGLLSYLRIFPIFSLERFSIQKTKHFAMLLTSSERRLTTTKGDPAGEVQFHSRNQPPTWSCHRNAWHSSLCWFTNFSSCLGNFRAEIGMPQPSDFSNEVQEPWNTADHQPLHFQPAPEAYGSRKALVLLFKAVTSRDQILRWSDHLNLHKSIHCPSLFSSIQSHTQGQMLFVKIMHFWSTKY